jgi:iron uptake system component EfeO
MRTRRLLAATSATLAAALAVALAGCGSDGTGQPSDVVTVSSNQCGSTWHLAGPGWHTFEISNQSTGGGEIDLIDPANGAVYDEIENIGPDTTTPMSLDVGSGKYAFLCLFEDFSPLAGPTVTVGGHASGTAAILPVTYNDVLPLASKYQRYTETGLQVLARETATLAADVRHGNLTAANRDWLTAHLQYETLGAAYDAFGNFDDEIDGRADAVGLNSPKWTGFYRLEYGLWHGQSAAELRPVASTLDTNVRQLLASWPTQQIPLLDIGLRTHEILENALEFQLTGHDDYGSGTTLATTQANIQGTLELLKILHPLLVARYRQLPAVYIWLDRLSGLIAAAHRPGGSWTPVGELGTYRREQIDAAASQALEELAPIAVITEPRRT